MDPSTPGATMMARKPAAATAAAAAAAAVLRLQHTAEYLAGSQRAECRA